MTVYRFYFFALGNGRLPGMRWSGRDSAKRFEELKRFKTFKNKLSWDLKFVFVLPVIVKNGQS